jgi:hypothetical protein
MWDILCSISMSIACLGFIVLILWAWNNEDK